MAEPIEYRRIRQKVDTYDNWMANPLILGDGEQAFVRNGDVVLNFRMGDGTKRFSELPNVIQYDQAAYVAAVGNTLPIPENGVGYSILGAGTYNGNLVVPAGNLGIASYSEGWTLNNVPLPTNPISNTVVKEGSLGTSQKAVYDFVNPIYDSENINYTPYVVTGVGYNGLGEEVTSGNSAIVKNMPVDPSKQTITIDNTYNDSLMKYFFRDAEGDRIGTGNVSGFNNTRMVIPIPQSGATISFTLYRASGALKPNFYVSYIAVENTEVSSILNRKIQAKSLSENNSVPDPTQSGNAVNKRFFDLNAIKDTDIQTSKVRTSNYLDVPRYKVEGFYINGAGVVIEDAENLHIIRNQPADEIAGKQITVNGVVQSSLKKFVFRDSQGAVINPVISLTTLPFTFNAPANASTFDMSLKAGNNTVDSYSMARISIGDLSQPYEPFEQEFIDSIKGKSIKSSNGGGESYNQSLNTTDDVQFNSINTGLLEMSFWQLNLPTGAGSPPSEVLVGHAWIDTNTDTIKVRRA